ncbi:alcohol dehydrogenase catalytic domain-containing protein [Modestobacter sp. I12A-02628]|uniref:NAD(P)-dependent alcohol dehydrogenase n=1 Tax=Goekera deserti TaxID=2497753 RepID=A0A7K3WIR2_9ACTN|nr:NAD(P)-dependent alcohol dehydrogenase [Goekera deserti]MPQ97104.1 alcohol dehydrogenase catalytic domain-containing protein [Goekera deserti]NDI46578.1 alcohol dehydrogenase catalytic domain-containing protein [Goekera deserti]NEL56334.1 NAD(P)-dependent alcohol dehydrogenase [Goekera deserti]
MRAAVLRAAGDVVVEERPTPSPGPGQVLVRVRSVGVCGSDTHYYEHGRIGRFIVESPLVLGHEAAGEVVELGEGVTGLVPGQRVSVEPGVPDLTCEQCLAGRYNLCPQMRFYATPPIDGAFAEYVLTHAAFAHPVPDGISDDAAALLEPLSVAVWACRKGRVSAGSRVLVTGAGPIGLLAVQTAIAFGATEVAVSDVNPARLALAGDMGATELVDARSASVLDLPRAPGVLLECSGYPPAISEGIRALAPAGRAVLVGMGGDEVPLPLSVVQERELEVTGTFRYAGTWPTAIALVAAGRVDLDRLVTGSYPLERAADALTAGRRDQHSVKVVVRPQT